MSLKQDIERELRLPVRIRMGMPGSLNVIADGKTVYSKSQSGRMPTSAELIAKLRQLATAT
ncbi:MAG TPA: Rdx family protein [Terriglobales bacterium]|nr:Rdx family protein [Terriglobales bacterium]